MGQPNLNQMMKQVQKMQADMAKAQEELKNEVVEASAGGGMVTVKISGELELKELKIDPEAVDPEDVDMLQDMVQAAVNEAIRSAQELAASKMNAAAGGLGGPGGLGGEVETDLALAHRGLHLADGVGQPERLLIGDAEDVEGQPLRGALPDPGQTSELGDEPVDGCCEQGRQRLAARAADPA